MDNVFLIQAHWSPQAGLFAAALTPFIIDSKQNLKVNPTDQIVYYLEQHSTILSQISRQISSIAPEVSIPSTPPPPFPPFHPAASDIRINLCWFLALVFSLSGALIATLIQQWTRGCLQTLQRHTNPTKNARLRQDLFEQVSRWNILSISESAPSLLHVSLFLFFAGLGDYALNLDKEVASYTIPFMAYCGFIYIFFTLLPIIYPQALFRSPISSLVASLFYKSRGLVLGVLKFIGARKFSSNTQGPIQLTKEDLEVRKRRDERAIRWMIDNMTEDTEMESFFLAIPGSFNTKWGAEVWKKVSEKREDESRSGITPAASTLARTPATHQSNIHTLFATPRVQGRDMPELAARVSRLLDTCKNRDRFASFEDWRKRTRACIETTASLVFRTNARLDWFGDIVKLLGEIGTAENTRGLMSMETDRPFVVRWTCLSLVTIRSVLERNTPVQEKARIAVESLAGEDDSSNGQALTRAQEVDGTLQNARSSLLQLNDALIEVENTEEQVKAILRDYEPQVLQLENINIYADHLNEVDQEIFDVQSFIVTITQGLARQIPGVQFDDFETLAGPVHWHLSRLVEGSHPPRQFIFPGQTLKSISSPGPIFRTILEGTWDADAHQEMVKNLKELLQDPIWKGNLAQRQLWRLQDLRDGGGLGFTVELFFLSLRELLSISSLNDSDSQLFIDALRVITSDQAEHRQSLGTQKLLLYMILPHGIISEFRYPTNITNVFFDFIGAFLEGQGGSHLDDAMQELSAPDIYTPYDDERDAFRDNTFRVITRARAPTS